MDGVQPKNSAKFTWIYVNLRVDAQANLGWISTPLEGQPGTGMFEIQSIGIDYAQNVVATLDLPAPVRLTALQIMYNPHGFQCSVLTPQRARCTGSYGVLGQEAPVTRVSFELRVRYRDQQHRYFALTADADGNAANDTSTVPIIVTPYIDVGFSLDSNPGALVMNVGEQASLDLTLTHRTQFRVQR